MNKLMLDFISALVNLLTGGFAVRDIAQAMNEVFMTLGAKDEDHLVLKKAAIDADNRVSSLTDVVTNMGAEGLRLADKLKSAQDELETTRHSLRATQLRLQETKWRFDEANRQVKLLEDRPVVPDYRCQDTYLKVEWGCSNRIPLMKYLRDVSGMSLETARDLAELLVGMVNVVGEARDFTAPELVEVFRMAIFILTTASTGVGHLQEEKVSEFHFRDSNCLGGKPHKLNLKELNCSICGNGSRFRK